MKKRVIQKNTGKKGKMLDENLATTLQGNHANHVKPELRNHAVIPKRTEKVTEKVEKRKKSDKGRHIRSKTSRLNAPLFRPSEFASARFAARVSPRKHASLASKGRAFKLGFFAKRKTKISES